MNRIFFAACFAAFLSPSRPALAAPRSAMENEDCAEISHPGENESDFSATNRLILRQTSCAAAEQVFNRCPHGAMYSDIEGSSVLDQSASVIGICEKALARDAKSKKSYQALTKSYCNFPGDSRQAVAAADECFHLLAVTLGKLVELREGQ